MPKTKTITLYQYAELPTKKAKERALDWLREGESQDWTPELEPYETAAKLLGIDLDVKNAGRTHGGKTIYRPAIHYSGFWSQGDGASFEGTYTFAPDCSKKVRGEFLTDTKLHEIADELTAKFTAFRLHGKIPGIAKLTQNGNYVHSHTMSLELPDASENVTADDEDRILESMRDFADWIYRGLEEEYEYATSDEALIDSMEANEYTFDEDGNREG